LTLINELHRYLKVPKIIVTTNKKRFGFEALQYEVTDILKPLMRIDFVKLVLKLNKSNNETEISYLKQSVVSNEIPKNSKIPEKQEIVDKDKP
jgi:hypothetical protein